MSLCGMARTGEVVPYIGSDDTLSLPLDNFPGSQPASQFCRRSWWWSAEKEERRKAKT